jgi:hypothetical protein
VEEAAKVLRTKQIAIQLKSMPGMNARIEMEDDHGNTFTVDCMVMSQAACYNWRVKHSHGANLKTGVFGLIIHSEKFASGETIEYRANFPIRMVCKEKILTVVPLPL